MKIKLDGVDDRGSLRSSLRSAVQGFRSSDLVALYLMTGQFSVGQPVTGGNVLDASGHGNHAVYQAGGSAVQTLQGQYFNANGGGIISPVAIEDSYTIIAVVSQDYSEGPADTKFPVFSITSAGLTPAVSTGNSPNSGGVAVTQQIHQSIAGSLDLGVYAPSPVFGGQYRLGASRPLAPSRSRFAFALSVDSPSNTIRFKSSAGDFTIVNSAAMDLVRACTGTHAFGLFSIGGAPLKGELCLGAIHNGALGADDLAREFDNAKRIVRRRGNIEIY